MAKLPLTPVDPQSSLVLFILGKHDDATSTFNHACRVPCFCNFGVLMLRINTVNQQEMAEGQKTKERKCAKGLEAKDFGNRT